MVLIFKNSLRFRHIIFFGILIRLALMPFFAHPFDMQQWYIYVETILNQEFSISSLYIFPIWKLLLIPIAYTYNILSNILGISVISVSSLPLSFDPSYGINVVTDPIFNILVKTPLIIADVLSALLIYKIGFYFTKDYFISKRSATLYFFSPIVIWISAAWGQYDSLAVLFMLLTIYLLIVSKRIILSSFSLFTAILIKIYPIILIFPIVFSLVKFDKKEIRKVIIFLLFLVPLVIYLFVFQKGLSSIIILLDSIFVPTNFFFTSGFGLTYWSVSLITPLDLSLSWLIMILILLLLSSFSIYYVVKLAKTRFDMIIVGSFLFIATFFLSLQFVTEQRSLALLAILSLVIIRYPSIRIYYVLLSWIAFLYAQKNFPFYILPIASRFPDSFSFLFSFVSPFVNRSNEFIAPTFISGLALFIMGTSFSGILVIVTYKILKKNNVFRDRK